MSYGPCDCGCQSKINDLRFEIDGLRSELESLRRDLGTEREDRREAITSVRNDLSDMYAEVTTRP